MRSIFSIIFTLILFNGANAQDSLITEVDSVWNAFTVKPDDEVLLQIDAAQSELYASKFMFNVDSTVHIEDSVAPPYIFEVNDDTMAMRMKALDLTSPFDFTYNNYVKAFIKLYVQKKRNVTEKVIGISPYYFPMFEEALARHNLPLELKYLPVVESALNPKARSRAGAMGLWQFMYRTGKMYGLNVTSYYDERMDPIKSTEAACLFLKDLYKIYGDWNLVIAAYNCGPGNVNKAIRRSSGRRDFWEIRSYLPRETRGYVPAFHAVNYTMNYAAEHDLTAVLPEQKMRAVDTVHICKEVSFETLSKTLDVDQGWLAYYNPTLKLEVIPATEKGIAVYLPMDKVGLFVTNEDSIYVLNEKVVAVVKKTTGKSPQPVVAQNEVIHRVRSGEVMGVIAQRYGVRVSQLKEWNGLWTSRIYPGQKLKIYTNKKPTTASTVAKAKTPPVQYKTTSQGNGKFNYYTIQPGDTLWDIAKKYKKVTVTDLKKLNYNLNFKKLKPGDRIKISKVG